MALDRLNTSTVNHLSRRTSLLAMLSSMVPAVDAADSNGKTGIALTPAHFPKHSAKDVTDMFRLGKEIGGPVVFIYQWSQPDFQNVAQQMMKMAGESGLTPILAISPTKLSGVRKDLDLPADVKARAGGKESFRNPIVAEAFAKDVLSLAQLKPPYLCLATEINFLAFGDINEYIAFAAVCKKIYPEIKKISPETKVFVSFQWDYFYIMDQKEPKKIQEHSKLIDIFRPELDLIAITSYPADHFSNAGAIPANYYEKIFDHVKKTENIIVMEIGWPTSGKGSEESQADFVKRLPALFGAVKPSVVAWSLLHDVSAGVLGGDLGKTGLITSDGKKKPGYDLFRSLKL